MILRDEYRTPVKVGSRPEMASLQFCGDCLGKLENDQIWQRKTDLGQSALWHFDPLSGHLTSQLHRCFIHQFKRIRRIF